MTYQFDAFTETLADHPLPRRQSLRLLGAALAGALVGSLSALTSSAAGRDPCKIFCNQVPKLERSRCLSACQACNNDLAIFVRTDGRTTAAVPKKLAAATLAAIWPATSTTAALATTIATTPDLSRTARASRRVASIGAWRGPPFAAANAHDWTRTPTTAARAGTSAPRKLRFALTALAMGAPEA